MTKDYQIDILQNEFKGFRGLRILAYVFIAFFILAGLFIFIRAYQKKSDWISYSTALTPFGIAFIVYLQVTGKWIYKKFLRINNDNILWTRSKLFGTTNISWTDVQSVDFEYTSINFKLIKGKTQRFDLINVSLLQIKELKDLLRDICLKKNINFITK
jgi:hypothetical protein